MKKIGIIGHVSHDKKSLTGALVKVLGAKMNPHTDTKLLLEEIKMIANSVTFDGGIHPYYKSGFMEGLAYLKKAAESGRLSALPAPEGDGLLPCPLCGSDEVRITPCDGNNDRIWCMRCDCQITGKHVSQVWNARPSPGDVANVSQSPGGWLPIETAPKDGTLILVMAGGYGLVYFKDGYWLDSERKFWSPHSWAPLPPPPSGDGERAANKGIK